MIIKVIKTDGSVVNDYTGTIIMDFEGQQDTSVYDMPSNGFYNFTPEDQGVRTFSKWLTIKKSGQYTIKAFDAQDETVLWSLPIIVWSPSDTPIVNERIIELLEPLSGTAIVWSALNVVWKSDSKRTPLQFFVDDKKILTEWETDDMGNFSVYLNEVTSWAHTLQVKMVDYEGKILGMSEVIDFTYTLPAIDWFLKAFGFHF